MKWSPQQDRALMKISRWLRDDDLCFRLFGYAGAGKTEIARAVGQDVSGVVYTSFTGKAVHVLRQRGCEPANTIHSLIYHTTFDQVTGTFIRELKPELAGVSLLIVDEASMIEAELARDLLSFGIKVLVIGDPAQLPPVKSGDGYFMRADADAMLDQVHRQALDSPVLRLANDVRQGKWLWKKGRYGGVVITDGVYSRDGLNYDVVLTGTNDTRQDWNRKLRIDRGFLRANQKYHEPQRGEVLVCLRNDYTVADEIFNGQLWSVHEVAHCTIERAGVKIPLLQMVLTNEDGDTEVRVPAGCFNGGSPGIRGLQQFDFGYALTVHKSQGSEWDRVLLINESRAMLGQSRAWLYTGITRASNALTIIDTS